MIPKCHSLGQLNGFSVTPRPLFFFFAGGGCKRLDGLWVGQEVSGLLTA